MKTLVKGSHEVASAGPAPSQHRTIHFLKADGRDAKVPIKSKASLIKFKEVALMAVSHTDDATVANASPLRFTFPNVLNHSLLLSSFLNDRVNVYSGKTS